MGYLDVLKNNIPSPNEINGSIGEWMAKIFSKSISDGYVIHDVLINGTDEYTSQIDLVIIGVKGIYVCEIKMFNDAKVYGDTGKSQWSYYSHGHKYEIYSPVKQNIKHIEYLKDFLKDFGDLPFYSIITMFCEEFKISGSFDGKTAVCNSLPMMYKALKIFAEGKPEIITEQKKKEIFEFISNNQYSGKESRKEHKKNVVEYKNSLEEMKKNKICPYCKTELVLRNGKNGEFYGCKSFPKCRYTLKKD